MQLDIYIPSFWKRVYNEVYLLYSLPFALPADVRKLFEQDLCEEEIPHAVRWECVRQGIDPESVGWEKSYRNAVRKADGIYRIELEVPSDIVSIRHEVRHIAAGHCETDESPRTLLKRLFVHEPSAFLYSAMGPSYKP